MPHLELNVGGRAMSLAATCAASRRYRFIAPSWCQTPHGASTRSVSARVAKVQDVETPAQVVVEDSGSSGDEVVTLPLLQRNRAKIICTVGPSTCEPERLLKLAKNGMDVARLNMTHGDHAWHARVINDIQALNEKGYNIAVMMDTEGSEAHLRARDPVKVQAGQAVVISIRPGPESSGDAPQHFTVSYESFVDDVRVDDLIMVDGGMVIVRVKAIEGPDVQGEVLEPGTILSRANLTLRRKRQLVHGSNSLLPAITAKDWQDIDFAVEHKVDFLAISFVRNASVIENVRSYVKSQLERRHPGHCMDVIAKMEAYESVQAMPDIIDAADGIMVARSDLGAQIPLEDVPAVQKEIVFRCRQKGKPVLVASQLLNSMIDVPVPTRAEVADCADAVRQEADALMLSGETAAGAFPVKCVQTLRNVCVEVENWLVHEKTGAMKYPKLMTTEVTRMQEELCTSAAIVSTNLEAKAIFVFTRTGLTAQLLSRRRPDCPILAITDSPSVARRLSLRWGVIPFLLELRKDPEENVKTVFQKLVSDGVLAHGDLVVCVSDVTSGSNTVRSVQLRHVE